MCFKLRLKVPLFLTMIATLFGSGCGPSELVNQASKANENLVSRRQESAQEMPEQTPFSKEVMAKRDMAKKAVKLREQLMPQFNAKIPKEILTSSTGKAKRSRFGLTQDERQAKRDRFFDDKLGATNIPPGPTLRSHDTGGWNYQASSYLFSGFEYQNNLDYCIANFYAPTGATAIQIYFDWIDLETSRDFVVIYDEWWNQCERKSGTGIFGYTANSCSGNMARVCIETDYSLAGESYDGFQVGGFYYYQPPATQYPPVAISVADDYTVNEGDVVYFDGSYSYDPDGSDWDLSYYWDFGDGYESYSKNPSHSYAVAGDYLVTLTVTDGDNLSDSDSIWITVNRQVQWPSASFSLATPTVGAGNPAKIFLDPASEAEWFLINWGDGSSQNLAKSSVDFNGEYHDYLSPGDYDVVVVATNSVGVDTQTRRLTKIGEYILPTLELAIVSALNKTLKLSAKLFDDGFIQSYALGWGGYDGGDLFYSREYLQSQNNGYDSNIWYISNSHRYTKNGKPWAGTYQAKAVVTDNHNLQKEAGYTFVTTNQPPVNRIRAVAKCNATLDCSVQIKPVIGFKKIAGDSDGEVMGYSWSLVSADKVTPVTGCQDVKVSKATCTFPGGGQYFVISTVIDNLGKTTTKTRRFIVKPGKFKVVVPPPAP